MAKQLSRCPKCRGLKTIIGKGHITKSCPHCDGLGKVEWDPDWVKVEKAPDLEAPKVFLAPDSDASNDTLQVEVVLHKPSGINSKPPKPIKNKDARQKKPE